MNSPEFFIDFSDLQKAVDVKKKDIDDICLNVGRTLSAVFIEKLVENVESGLNRTAQDYIDAIQVKEDSNSIQVSLDSKNTLAISIEEGASPYDMKPYLLNSSKVKIAKDGTRYLSVPFKWATTSAKGTGFANKMTRSVYDEVRREGSVSNKTAQSKKIISRPTIYDSAGSVVFNEYKHKTSTVSGIKKYPQGSRSSYYSFRTVSEKSDPDSFIHKGFQARNFFDQTLLEMNIEELASNIFSQEMQ